MCEVMEKYAKEVYGEEWRQEWRQEGRQEERISTIIKMIRIGIPEENIRMMEYTDTEIMEAKQLVKKQ